MKFIVKKSQLKGTTRIPGNKSATARAIVLGGLADGVSRVRNPLPGIDSFSIVEMMRALGPRLTRAASTNGALKVWEMSRVCPGPYLMRAIPVRATISLRPSVP